MIINNEALKNITDKFNLQEINMLFEKYSINTLNRISGFLAQCAHESADFKYKIENLNYSDTALLKIFPKYFKDEKTAKEYARKPEKIANRVYANRMGNGDENSGDGYKYRGRGYIQITGKNNYIEFSKYINKTVNETIDYCMTDKGALESALFFWKKNDINKFCDDNDIISMTKAVNGGVNGIDDRKNRYEKYKNILNKYLNK